MHSIVTIVKQGAPVAWVKFHTQMRTQAYMTSKNI